MPKPTFIEPHRLRNAECSGGSMCLGCGREIQWAFALCAWCREQRVEDLEAGRRDADDNRVHLAEHNDRTPKVNNYGHMQIEVLPRNRDGSLSECDNHIHRTGDKMPEGWW